LLREVSSAPVIDLARLLDAVIFNYVVGNNDAHGKNFSLLYRGVGTENLEIALAPLYDVVSTVYYPELSLDMAMKIGGEYSSDKVTGRYFEQLATDAGLGKPLVRGRVQKLLEKILTELPTVQIDNPVAGKVADLIRQRAKRAKDRLGK
jgi:serine/threonine-protein kinase HipA